MIKVLNGKTKSVTVAAIIVGGAGLVSRFLGVFRDRILAGEFGAGDTLDIYYAAFRVPDLVFNLLVLGALSAGFVPVLTRLIKDWQCQRTEGLFAESNKRAWELVNNIFNEQYESNAWVYRYMFDGKEYTMDGYFPQAGINFLGGIELKF